jgi:hypothetical protein
MIIKFKSFIHAKPHSFIGVCGVAGVLQFGLLAGSAQTNKYLFTGAETTITLNAGTYDITACGARGGNLGGNSGGFGAKMEGRFSFATTVNLTLLVGGAGGPDLMSYAAGGGGGSFVVNGSIPLVVAGGGGGAYLSFRQGGPGSVSTAGGSSGNGNPGGSGGSGGAGGNYGGGGGGGYSGDGSSATGSGGGGSSFLNGGAGGGGGGIGGYNHGGYGGGGGAASTGAGGGGGYSGGGGGGGSAGGGGGSIIDSSAIAIIAEVSGIASPDGSPNGEIIITAVPNPIVLASASTASGDFSFNITGPTNATIVVEVCSNLANPAWISVATNVLSNGTNYFSDAQWTNYTYHFYRVREP